ncbi:carbohydrate ABC transporter permease [Methylovirgula sp. 4M-Z18]|uniref:carbohydrate ABC transporter permease n=1 Tax=Methylovirgula sp. 4M-Z18 TaxID=2293567 RepID=UPI000E2F49A0|nr:sugar ABC transporter permease [Methylovirgula sp. 4M-Z18]RFB78727.1 sugar ABC transporter permease [Methylovirgula sp. 4M-Z18]
MATTNLSRTKVRSAWLFLAPMLITLALVAGWPLVRTIWFSFTDAKLDNLDDIKFIGFDNFFSEYGVMADDRWWISVKNTLEFSVISVALETVLGLIVALVLNANFPGRGIVRAAILVPWAIPTIVSAKMWAWMLNDQNGIVNGILQSLHIVHDPIAWIANPHLSFWTVVLVDVWKTTPFMALLSLAALQLLPSDCYEAAEVDGISPVKVFFQVTLPLIRPALIVAVIFRSLDALRIFDLIYVLTPGSDQTITMAAYAREQLSANQDFGMGSAASTLLFLIIGLITILTLMVGRVKLAGETR